MRGGRRYYDDGGYEGGGYDGGGYDRGGNDRVGGAYYEGGFDADGYDAGGYHNDGYYHDEPRVVHRVLVSRPPARHMRHAATCRRAAHGRAAVSAARRPAATPDHHKQ